VREELALDAPLLPLVRGGPLTVGGRMWGGNVLGGSCCCTEGAAPDVGGKNWLAMPLLNCGGGGRLPGAPAPG